MGILPMYGSSCMGWELLEAHATLFSERAAEFPASLTPLAWAKWKFDASPSLFMRTKLGIHP